MKIKQYAALAAAAASLMTCTAAVHAESSAFVDISPQDWYYTCVYQASELGLMGFSDGYSFEPDAPMTRAQFVQGLYALAGKPEVAFYNRFTDVSQDAWYASAVLWAVSNHITSGISETEFGPEEPLTREQAAVFLYLLYSDNPTDYQQQQVREDITRYAEQHGLVSAEEVMHFGPYEPLTVNHTSEFFYTLYGAQEETAAASVDQFWDYKYSDEWAQPALEWALAEGLLSGSTDMDGSPLLDAAGNLTRAQGAAMLTTADRLFYNVTVEVEIPETSNFNPSAITTGTSVPVLMYHEVSDNVWGIPYLFVSPSSMREQLQYLADNGYDTIFFSDLDHLQDYDKPIILTLDDGYEGNYTELYPLLQEFNMKVTIFMIADDINRENFLTEAQLKEMSDSGLVSVQSHTYSHRKLDSISESELYTEYEQSKNVIARVTGKVPYVVSYPQGAYTSASVSIAQQYYSLGILDRGGQWTSSQSNLFYIPRTVIPRDYTVQDFAYTVNPPLVAPVTSNALGSSITAAQ